MKPLHLVLPSLLAAFAVTQNESPSRGLAARGESQPNHAGALASASLAWSDVDRDGLVDVLAIDAQGQVNALRNVGNGHFEPFADAVGLASLPLVRSVAWQDFDADGAEDLLFVSLSGELGLLRNEEGAFVPAARWSGLPTGGILDARWADYDSDKLADLILFTSDGYAFHHNLGRGMFELGQHVVAPQGLSIGTPAGALPAPDVATPGDADVRGASSGDPTPVFREQRAARSVIGREPSASPGGASGPSTGVGPQPLLVNCARSLRDTSTGNCLTAASTPELGSLYPLSIDLNVDADGDVGIGSTSPSTKLFVSATGKVGVFGVSDREGGHFSTTSTSTTVPALRASTGTGELAAFFDGDLQLGYTQGFPLFLDVSRMKLRMDAATASLLEMSDGTGTETFEVDSDFGSGARVSVRRDTGSLGVNLVGGNGTTGGLIGVHQENGIETVQIVGSETPGNGAQLTMRNFAGATRVEIDAEGGSLGPVMDFYSSTGQETIELRAEETAGTGSQITLRNGAGVATIILDADTNGDGYVIADVMQITGGADLVESFDVSEELTQPGMVLVIDPSNPGGLRQSRGAYDRRVAGVVSGANGVQPGLRLGQAGVLDGDTPVALTGRVYVLCTHENGTIEAGDLLTSSSTAGHAMRASDPERTPGSVLGKALSGLNEETGMVLVLVSLQ